MKKIAILTFHNAHNYGAMLQAYALQKKCEEYGKCEILDYENKKISNQYKIIRIVGKNPINIIKRAVLDIKNYKKRKLRAEKFNNFMNGYMNLSLNPLNHLFIALIQKSNISYYFCKVLNIII